MLWSCNIKNQKTEIDDLYRPIKRDKIVLLSDWSNKPILSGPTPASFSFIFGPFKQTSLNFYNKYMWNFSIQHTVPGFEPTAFGTWASFRPGLPKLWFFTYIKLWIISLNWRIPESKASNPVFKPSEPLVSTKARFKFKKTFWGLSNSVPLSTATDDDGKQSQWSPQSTATPELDQAQVRRSQARCTSRRRCCCCWSSSPAWHSCSLSKSECERDCAK